MEEDAYYPAFYPGLKLEVFAPDWYYRGYYDKHPHSAKIIKSKNSDESKYFLPKLKELISLLIKEKKLGGIDLITIIPKSDLKYSKTLEIVAERIGKDLKVDYEKIIVRIAKGRRNLSGNMAEKRFEKTKGSMRLKRNIKPDEKNILLLDDQKTTGITLLECAKILKEKGARNIFCICLGINRNLEKYPLKKRGVTNG